MADFPGTPGPDDHLGGDGPDRIAGLGGEDSLNGAGGDDSVDGGAGDDSVEGGLGSDEVWGGDGDDTVQGEDWDVPFQGSGDTLFGGAGHDALWGMEGSDTLYGGAGDDRLYAHAAEWFYRDDLGQVDALFGGEGDDAGVFTCSDGTFEGGAGQDTLVVEGVHEGGPMTVAVTGTNGAVTAAQGFTVTFASVEALHVRTSYDAESGYDDAIATGAGNDVIEAWYGANTVSAGAGDDEVTVDVGEAQSLQGGEGFDRLVLRRYDFGADGVLFDGRDADAVQDGYGSTIGGFEEIAVYTGDGDDTIHMGEVMREAYGNGGTDALYGGETASTIDGGDGSDLIDAGGGGDTVTGSDGADDLRGGAGEDWLRGGRDGDSVAGGEGADRISGGAGSDTLTGGEGADHFVFNRNHDLLDRIADFEAGVDVIHVRNPLLPEGALDPARLAFGAATGTDGQFVLLDDGADDRLVWDGNGTAAGGVVEIAVLAGESGLTAADILVF